MTYDQWIELGRRAVACKHWRWVPGMLAHKPGGIWEWRRHSVAKWSDALGVRDDIPADAVPDLGDPATLGCLLALVREAWGKPLLYVEPEEDEIDGLAWYVWNVDEGKSYSRGLHRSEAAALVAALEAAP